MPISMITQEDRDELQSIIGPEFALPEADDPSFVDKTIDVFSQLGTGFFEGYTTIHAGNEPLSVAGKIARGIGNLAGFIGFIPDPGDIIAAPSKAALLWGTKGMQKAVAKRILKKEAKKLGVDAVEIGLKSGDMINKARQIAGPMGIGQLFGGVLKGKSVPLLFSSGIMKTPAVKTTLRSAESLINRGIKGQRARDMFKGAVYGAAELGPAMAISGFSINPWDDRELSERVSAGLHGLASGGAYGGAFGLIGNMGTVVGDLMIAGKPRSADKVLKALAGATIQGAPSTIGKAPLEDQVFNWLLGGYFGATTHPWQVRETARAQQEAMAANDSMLSATAYMRDWAGFIKASGLKKIYEYDPAAADIALRNLLEHYGAPEKVIGEVATSKDKFKPMNYEYGGNKERAKEAEEMFGVDPSKVDEYVVAQEAKVEASNPSTKMTDVGKAVADPIKDAGSLFRGAVRKTYDYVFKSMVDNFKDAGKDVHQSLLRTLDKSQELRGAMTLNLERVHKYGSGEGKAIVQKAMEEVEVAPGSFVPRWRLAIERESFGGIDSGLTARELEFVNEIKALLTFGGNEMAAENNAPRFEHRIEIMDQDTGAWVPLKVIESGRTIIMRDADGNIRRDADGKVTRWKKGDIESLGIAPRIFGEDIFSIFKFYNPDKPTKGVGGHLRRVLRELNKDDPLIDGKIEKFFAHWGKMARTGVFAEAEGATTHLAQEFARTIENFPSIIEYNGRKYQLFETNPIKYADAYVNRSSNTIGYMREFGQGVNFSGPLDPNSAIGKEYADLIAMQKEFGVDLIREVIESKDTFTSRVREKSQGKVDESYIDAMQRVLNGMPADMRMTFNPEGPAYRFNRGLKSVLSLYRSAMLTASVIPNIAESVAGDVPAILGYKAVFNGLKALATNQGAITGLTLKETYNLLGALTLDPANFTIDPSRPGRERVRVATDMMKRAFGHHYINELQEHMSVAAADAKWRLWNQGEVSKQDSAFLKNNLGFSETDIELLMRPKKNRPITDAEQDARLRFLRRVAQYLTSAKLSKGHDSLAANTRWFGEVFPFMSYGMKKVARMKDMFDGVKKAYEAGRKDSPDNFSAAMKAMKSSESYLFGRVLGSTVSQGALAYMLLGLAFGGTTGLHAAINEATDEPVKFMFDSFLYSTLTGPFAAIARYSQDPDQHPAIAFSKATFPGMVLDEIHKFASGQGIYKDQTLAERVSTYFTRRIPAAAPLATAMSVVGLSDRDPALEGSIRAYWKWRYDEFPPGQFKTGYMEEEHKKFRQYMRRAMSNIRQGRDPRQNINNAIAVKDGNTKSAIQSIRTRRLLYGLEPEQLESLRSRVGDSAYQKLVDYDNILTGWAEAIGGGFKEE